MLPLIFDDRNSIVYIRASVPPPLKAVLSTIGGIVVTKIDQV